MNGNTRTTLRGGSTRDALLDAATLVFAREGFGSANLREIALAAGVNPALIGYHFHGKEGLYLAVFERMVSQIQAVWTRCLVRIDRALEAPVGACPPEQRKSAAWTLLQLLEAMLTYMVHEHPSWGELFVREQQRPPRPLTPLRRRHQPGQTGPRGAAAADPRRATIRSKVRLLAAAIASQVLLIRIARTPLMRLLEWERIGDRSWTAMKDTAPAQHHPARPRRLTK